MDKCWSKVHSMMAARYLTVLMDPVNKQTTASQKKASKGVKTISKRKFSERKVIVLGFENDVCCSSNKTA